MNKYITEDGEIADIVCENCNIQFLTPHNHNTLAMARAGALTCLDESKTDESFKEEADINTIVDRLKLGQVTDVPLPEHFGVDERVTLIDARTRIAESNATFYNLPAHIRAQFLNDPAIWERRVFQELHKENRAGLRDMGLDVPDPPAKPTGGTPAPSTAGEPGGVSAPPATPKT